MSSPPSGLGRETGTMQLTLNGEPIELESGSTLRSLLEVLGRDARTVAVEHNGEIVRRDRFEAVRLQAGDRIEVVHFVQGG